ncbi:MAG: ATP synthase F0 subunit A, partial [Opitutaceae bacterium]
MSRVTQYASLLLLFLVGTSSVFAAGVAPSAAKLIDFGHGWALTNSMVTGWAISLLLVLAIRWLIGKPSIVPSRGQAVFESLLEGLSDIFEPIVGKKAFPAAFPILVT